VQRGIIHPDEGQFAAVRVNRRRLIVEQRNLMPLRPVAELLHGDAAVVVVIAQRDIDRGDGAQLSEESEQVRQAFRNIQQVAGDENPVRLQSFDLVGDQIMAGLVAVEMEIAQMDGPVACQHPVGKGQAGDGMLRQADFAPGKQAEEAIEGFTQAGADKGPDAIGPRMDNPHLVTRSISARSAGETR
jgi:hypothetical protein